jgi:uncharacterized protein (DUF488 family)
MEVYTIGFKGKTAAEFFGALKKAGIKRVLDVRLNNTSHLAGFARKEHLPFFLKEICGAEYVHEPAFAPTEELLTGFQSKKIKWEEYEIRFMQILADRKAEEILQPDFFNLPTALLCSETKADKCHRRLVLEYLNSKWGSMSVVHL